MSLDDIRNEIDRIDREIVDLLNRRYRCVQEVGEYKRERQLPIYVPEREQMLLRRLNACNHGPLPEETLAAIYREIMAGAIRLEQPISVGFLGPAGSFSHQAAQQKFGRDMDYRTMSSIQEVFTAVAAGRVDYGCVPVENSIEGVVNPTLDALRNSDLRIIGEFNCRIRHLLLSNYPPEQIERIYSHPQILGQCREYLQNNMRGVELIEVSSSTRGAELALHEANAAAISSAMAAERFQLPVVVEGVEDDPRNTTRFVIIANQDTEPTGDDKTSICFSLRDRAGALYDALKPLRENGITMTLIESRPLKQENWQYCFFVDMLGHRKDEKIAGVCKELESVATFVKVLGSYPRTV